MIISPEKKKELLLSNFELLKDDYADNTSSLDSIVSKMFKIDEETAKDMWVYLVTKHEKLLRKDDYAAFFLGAGLLHDICDSIGDERTSEIVINTPALKRALFCVAYDSLSFMASHIVLPQIRIGNLQYADELMTLLYENKRRQDDWFEIMDSAMPSQYYEFNISEETYNFYEFWCNKEKDKKERAKLTTRLMDLLEEEE